MNFYTVVVTTNEIAETAFSPLFVSKKEASDCANTWFNKICSRFAANLSLDIPSSFCKEDCFRIVAGETWYEGNIVAFENPIQEPNTDCPQTVFFEGNSSEEIQGKVNSFLVRNPNIEIIDTELSTNLETTSVEHYFKVVYALVYKKKDK